jgi:hypothetical protein
MDDASNQPSWYVLRAAARYLHVGITDQMPYSLMVLQTITREAGTKDVFRLWLVQLGEQPNTCYVAQIRRSDREIYLAS